MLVFCSGMLRSGSAFQFNLAASLLEKTAVCIRHGRWERGRGFEKFTKQQIHSWANDKTTFHVIKSGIYGESEEIIYAKKGLAKILFINRDLRDVAVAAKYKWGVNNKELIELLDRAESTYNAMLKMQAFEKDWCLHQKYEEVFNNTFDAIEQISKFLGINPSKDIIQEVIEECSIKNMLKVSKSKTLKFKEITLRFLGRIANIIKRFLPPPYNKSWKLRKYYLGVLPKVDEKTVIAPRHIEPTKGVPGAWRSKLSNGEIKQITERYNEYLKKEKYII